MSDQLKIIRKADDQETIHTFDYEEFVSMFYPYIEQVIETDEQRLDKWRTAVSMTPITIEVDEINDEESIFENEYDIREMIEEKYEEIEKEIEKLKRRLFGEE